MSRLKCVTLLLMIVLPNIAAFTAPDSYLLSRIENAVKEKEPRWKLKKKRASAQNKYTLYEWKSGKSFAGAFVLIVPSRERAAEALKGLTYDFEVHGLKMVITGAVPNLGDENYEWRDPDHDGVAGVDFRRGAVVVHVKASSLEIAKRFARHIADVIPDAD